MVQTYYQVGHIISKPSPFENFQNSPSYRTQSSLKKVCICAGLHLPRSTILRLPHGRFYNSLFQLNIFTSKMPASPTQSCTYNLSSYKTHCIAVLSFIQASDSRFLHGFTRFLRLIRKPESIYACVEGI